ncbi:MAG: hypothetical protein KDB65_12210 [Calditrichaeota bacterium]|nr:hypothetical protein [Calditrichota bacterium]MCB9367576.1 hypothetical protein [Calditrichota bacterium]
MYNNRIHLFPFGLAEEDYKNSRWGEEEDISGLGVYVTLIATDQRTMILKTSNSCACVKRIKPALKVLDGRPVENRRIDTIFEPCALDAHRDLLRSFTNEHRRWIVDGWYVQVGFAKYDSVGQPGIETCIGTSMLLYDILTVRHGSTFTVDHEPLELSANSVRDIKLAMGQHFQFGSVIFTPTLERYRNKVAVMCRAALAGENPVKAYQEFLSASKTHFLDFEIRDAPDKYETYVTVKGGPENRAWRQQQ